MKFYSKQISGYEVGIYNNIIHELFLRPAGRIYYYWSLKLIVHSNKTNTINYYTNDVHDRDDRQAINNYLIVSTYAPDRIIFFYFALTWNFMVILDWMVVSRVFGWMVVTTEDRRLTTDGHCRSARPLYTVAGQSDPSDAQELVFSERRQLYNTTVDAKTINYNHCDGQITRAIMIS